MSEHPTATPAEILEQIGWNRDDTCFVSLNFTPEQMDILANATANDASQGGTLEESIVRAVNSHAKLVIALQAAELWINQTRTEPVVVLDVIREALATAGQYHPFRTPTYGPH